MMMDSFLDFASIVICPYCKTALSVEVFSFESDQRLDGKFHCKSCDRIFPIIKGISYLGPDGQKEQLCGHLLRKYGLSKGRVLRIKRENSSDALKLHVQGNPYHKVNAHLEGLYTRIPEVNIYQNPSLLIRWYFHKRLEEAVKLSGIDREACALDLGCGAGFFLPSLMKNFRWAIGLDFEWGGAKKETSLLEVANIVLEKATRTCSNVFLVSADGLRCPFRDKSFDVVYCLDVMEHVKNQGKLAQEVGRILKNRGVSVFSLPIESGLARKIKNLVAKATNFPRSAKTHHGFRYERALDQIQSLMHIERTEFVPFSPFRSLNPTIMIKARKET